MIEDEGWFYLEPDDVRGLLAEWVEPVEYPGKLEAACAYPRQVVFGHTRFATAAEKAGALGYAISGMYHPFLDGNKRAGALATLDFAYRNGYDFIMTEGELLAIFAQIARGLMRRDEVIAFLSARVAPMGRGAT